MEVSTEPSKAKACRNCQKAKAKCYSTLANGQATDFGCERCTRLNKVCVMPLQSKKKLGKPTRAAQISQLEQKVDSIASILNVTKSLPNGRDAIASYVAQPSEYTEQTPKIPINSRSPAQHFKTHTYERHSPDSLLRRYQENLANQFPFVSIEESVGAEELCQSKPFLYKAILIAASFDDVPCQVSISKDIMKDMTNRLFEDGEKDLDLLQGLLIYIVWYQFNFMTSGGQLNVLLGIMASLLVDLRLIGNELWTRQDALAENIYREFQGHPRRTITIEEKKVVLGCFYVSSWVCASATKLDPIRSTTFIRECCEDLERYGKTEKDVYVVQLIKLQFIVEKICLLHGRGEARTQDTLSAPIGLSVKLYWEQLRNYRDSLPVNLSDDFLITRNYTCAEVLLFELGFVMAPSLNDLRVGGILPRRIDILHACLTSIISFFTIFLAASTSQYLGITIINGSHMVHAIAVLSKLSLFEAEDWDPKHVRDTLDLNMILDRLIQRSDLTARNYDQTDSHPGWKRGSRVVQTLKTWYNSRLPQIPDTARIEAGNTGESFENLLPDQMDLMDAAFWNGVPGSWVCFN
ncbi:tRNA processing endoribonuclease [Phlyctema vagabunda]|uniref:tRNA processing endoribonuclease n=1 Tax=Phlyctema vagabunda TaxID=108571 RepID=A0ABR4PPX2_9HELO